MLFKYPTATKTAVGGQGGKNTNRGDDGKNTSGDSGKNTSGDGGKNTDSGDGGKNTNSGDGEIAAIRPNVSACLPYFTSYSPVNRAENALSVLSERHVEPLYQTGCQP